MKWNLRLAAANRGIWKASELQRMLAERGLVISAGKMSGLWSGQPNTVRLDELDVICAVLGCGVEELLLPEPETVPRLADGEQAPAVAEARPVTPPPVTCLHCGTPIPAGSRRDRVYCNNNCSALASYYRRKSGAAPPPRWPHPAFGSASTALRAAADRAR